MTTPLKPSLRISGGTPAGMPDFKPMNPWGRMPKRPPKQDRTLWVCNVEDRDTKQRLNIGLIGPKAGAEMLRDAVLKMNELGKCWAADPQVIRILS